MQEIVKYAILKAKFSREGILKKQELFEDMNDDNPPFRGVKDSEALMI
jgi:hypothetical protein